MKVKINSGHTGIKYYEPVDKITGIMLIDGTTFEVGENQVIQLSKSGKTYELWDNNTGLPRFVKRFRRNKVLWVFEQV